MATLPMSLAEVFTVSGYINDYGEFVFDPIVGNFGSEVLAEGKLRMGSSMEPIPLVIVPVSLPAHWETPRSNFIQSQSLMDL